MALTNEQIQHLFAFTKKKYVRYYDVQAELVDHLAERIEEEITANPQLSYENALAKVYAEFGIFGFAKIVQQKEAEVLRSARRLWFNELLTFFTWPKITFVLALFLVSYQFTIWFSVDILKIISGVLWLVFLCIHLIKKPKFPKIVKNLLLFQNEHRYSFGIGFYCQYLIFSIDMLGPLWLSTIVTACIVTELIAREIHKKVKSKAFQLYPEAFITAS